MTVELVTASSPEIVEAMERLILDEEGTVAAALSEGEVAVMAAPEPDKPIEFTVDHPYVLRLRDLTSGTALVEAAVMDPTVKTIGAST